MNHLEDSHNLLTDPSTSKEAVQVSAASWVIGKLVIATNAVVDTLGLMHPRVDDPKATRTEEL